MASRHRPPRPTRGSVWLYSELRRAYRTSPTTNHPEGPSTPTYVNTYGSGRPADLPGRGGIAPPVDEDHAYAPCPRVSVSRRVRSHALSRSKTGSSWPPT